jgi:hypothetical protein
MNRLFSTTLKKSNLCVNQKLKLSDGFTFVYHGLASLFRCGTTSIYYDLLKLRELVKISSSRENIVSKKITMIYANIY